MKLTTKTSEMIFNEKGSLISYRSHDNEMLAAGGENRPLFTVRLRDDAGAPVDVDAFSFSRIHCTGDERGLHFAYDGHPALALRATAHICVDAQEDCVRFTMDLHNDPHHYIEYLDYPEMTVQDDFVGSGGTGKLFWPAMEGCEVVDPAQRDTEMAALFHYKPLAYPSKGWEGFYPGPVQMQFMAYYNEKAGFYFGAHDPQHHPKGIEYHRTADGVRMEYKTMLAIDKGGEYVDGFAFVIKDNVRDWMDAAQIYRTFAHTNYEHLPEKFAERKNVPQWLKDSPMILIYPVRGEKDTGQMNPNCFFPYENILPVVERYAEMLDTQIMVLLMHWEGTAPWAPPYIWPPYGGEEMFRKFVGRIHDAGHLVGLYASGIGWTDESVLWPEYQMEQFRLDNDLTKVMCAAPDQSLPHSLICNGPIRWGYDMCPANDFVRECVTGEIGKVIDSGVDYLQYFDQNLGGMSELCFSRDHGHLPVHGKWAVDAMNNLYGAVAELIRQKNANIVIGCEAAAAECYSKMLTFSDLRYNINIYYANPVPAYAYVYHAYLFNFMGNENSFNAAVPEYKNPYSLHFRMAYSFAAGDVLTGVLNGKGELFWDWGTVWSIESPDQPSLLKLARRLIGLRKGLLREHLLCGTMIRPLEYTAEDVFKLIRSDDSVIEYPAVLSTAWVNEAGEQIQVFVNFTAGDKTVTLERPCPVLTEQGEGAVVSCLTIGEYDAVAVRI